MPFFILNIKINWFCMSCCLQGSCMAGCMYNLGNAWLGAFMAGEMHESGACIAGYVHGRGYAWRGWGAGGVHEKWQLACGRYTSYWNAILVVWVFRQIIQVISEVCKLLITVSAITSIEWENACFPLKVFFCQIELIKRIRQNRLYIGGKSFIDIHICAWPV